MEYTYRNAETGKDEVVKPERWVWGVLYKPTPEQIKQAQERTKELRKGLVKERVEKEAQARKQGASREVIQAIRKEYEEKAKVEVAPEQDELRQFDGKGVFHRIGEIDQKRVELFFMHPWGDESKAHIVVFPEGARIIHKYRNVKPHYADDFRRAYVYGWTKDGQECLHFILPDDRVVVSQQDNVDLVRFSI